MRRVDAEADFIEAVESASREASSAFGNGDVFLEKFIEHPRHIEVQIIADSHGNTVHLGERECSIQRRHQKIIEEAPSPAVDKELRASFGEAAVRMAIRTAASPNEALSSLSTAGDGASSMIF